MKNLKYLSALFIVGLIGAWFNKTSPAQKYVFINTTLNHEFDESIRTTIFANQARADVQNAVVIADQIPKGVSIEIWAADLFKKLKLGTLTQGRALLYLYVPSLKILKIEVGYALEAALPDITVKALEEAAKSFTYQGRDHDFWSDLINTLNIVIYQQSKNEPIGFDLADWQYASGGAGVTNPNYKVNSEQLKLESASLAPGDQRFQPASSPEQTIEVYLQSLNEGLGDANLPFLSTASRVFRNHFPLNRALLKRMYKMYREASPSNIKVDGNQALVWFKPEHPVLPIFLFKDDQNRWLVHEPYSYSLFNRFEDSMSVFQTHPVTSQSQVFRATGLSQNIIYRGAHSYSPKPIQGEAFFQRILQLEKEAEQMSPEANFALADLYLFELWDYKTALEYYQKGLAFRMDAQYLWTTLAPLMAAGKVSEFLKTYKQLVEMNPRDLRLKSDFDFYSKALNFKDEDWLTVLDK